MSKENPSIMTLQCMTGKGLTEFLQDKTLTVDGLPYLGSDEVMKEIGVRLHHADRLKEIINGWKDCKTTTKIKVLVNAVIPLQHPNTVEILLNYVGNAGISAGVLTADTFEIVKTKILELPLFSNPSYLGQVLVQQQVTLEINNKTEIELTFSSINFGQQMQPQQPVFFGPGSVFGPGPYFNGGMAGFNGGMPFNHTQYDPGARPSQEYQRQVNANVSLTGGLLYPFGYIKIPLEVSTVPGRYFRSIGMMVLNSLPGLSETGELGKCIIDFFNGKEGTPEAWPKEYSLNGVIEDIARITGKELNQAMQRHNVVVVLYNDGASIRTQIFNELFATSYAPGRAPQALVPHKDTPNVLSITGGRDVPFELTYTSEDTMHLPGTLQGVAAYMVLNNLPNFNVPGDLYLAIIGYCEDDRNPNWDPARLPELEKVVKCIDMAVTGGEKQVLETIAERRLNVVVLIPSKGELHSLRVIVEPRAVTSF